jgi:hypothetical protein
MAGLMAHDPGNCCPQTFFLEAGKQVLFCPPGARHWFGEEGADRSSSCTRRLISTALVR